LAAQPPCAATAQGMRPFAASGIGGNSSSRGALGDSGDADKADVGAKALVRRMMSCLWEPLL